MGEIDQPAGRLQYPLVHLVVKTEAGLHNIEVDLVVGNQVDQHLLGAPRPGDAVDEIHIPGRSEADGVARIADLFALRADGRVVEPVGRRKMRAVELFELVDPSKGQVRGLEVLTPFELRVFVTLAPVTLHAAVGKSAQLRPRVRQFHIAEIVAHHAEQLFHIRQPEMVHNHLVHLGRTLVFDRDTIVSGAVKGPQGPFPSCHG